MRRSVLFPVLLLASCQPAVRTVMQDVPVFAWEKPVTIVFDSADTVALNDLYVVVRYNDAFVEDTLTLRIATCSPDSLCCGEELLLATASEHTAAPLRSQQRIPYRRRVRFSRAGEYHMTFTPARPVRGVESVGLQIEKER